MYPPQLVRLDPPVRAAHHPSWPTGPRTRRRRSRRAIPPALVAVLVIAVASVLAAPAIGRAAVPGVDWTDLPTQPLALPGGWTAEACSADAPVLCTVEGDVAQGGVEHLSYPLDGGELQADLAAGTPARLALIREVDRFQESIRADRQAACPQLRYVPDPTVGATVVGLHGVRYGFTLFGDGGRAVERTIGFMALRPTTDQGLVLDVITAHELDEGSCTSPEGMQPFTAGGLGRFTPTLVQLVARSTAGPGSAAVRPAVAGPLTADDAVTTATTLAQVARPDGAPGSTVLIARDDAFADALASGTAQGILGAPLLLTGGDRLDDRVAAEIGRLGATRAIILGGESALSAQVEADLRGLALDVTRTAGDDRVATALAVADAVAPDTEQVVLVRADGEGSRAYADALAAGALAAEQGIPLLLTDGDVLDPRVEAWMETALAERQLDQVLIAGGESAVGLPVRQAVVEVGLGIDPAIGADRAETAVQLAVRRGLPTAAHAGGAILVDGTDWVAGVTSALLSAETLAPVLLTDGAALPPATASWLDAEGDPLAADVRVLCTPGVRAPCPAGEVAG